MTITEKKAQKAFLKHFHFAQISYYFIAIFIHAAISRGQNSKPENDSPFIHNNCPPSNLF